MNTKQRTLVILILVVSLVILGCGQWQTLVATPTPMPTNTPISTNTPVPTNTPISAPGIGVSAQSFQSAFEAIGFTFETYDNIQGNFTSADFQTWIILILAGPQEDLSSATLSVMNGTDQEKVVEILNLFFQVAFPIESERSQAMDWLINKSGSKTGQDKGETTIGNIYLSWAKDAVAGYFITVTAKTP